MYGPRSLNRRSVSRRNCHFMYTLVTMKVRDRWSSFPVSGDKGGAWLRPLADEGAQLLKIQYLEAMLRQDETTLPLPEGARRLQLSAG